MINVRVAASQLSIAEVCSYESSRIHGVSNLNAIRDGTRVLRTIQREFIDKAARRGPGSLRRLRNPSVCPTTSAEQASTTSAEQAS